LNAEETAPSRPAVRALFWRYARRYAFLAIPAIGLLELSAHVVQATTKIPPADWAAARDAVKNGARPEDLVAFSPRWIDPLGREYFKSDLATIDREARADATRFPRAFEVSIRGEHLSELAAWKIAGTRRFGAITVTTFDNPSPVKVIDDLVDHTAPSSAQVALVEGGNEADCPWTHGSPQTGQIGFGPGLPAGRFVCPRSAFVATSVVQALDYRPHKCIYAPPVGGGGVLRIRFVDVEFGRALHGYQALSWDAARFDSPPVTLVWKVAGKTLARLVEQDKDGWKPFEIDTSDLKGQKSDLIAEVSAPSSAHRQYCFEADTR
jgi:hypothetical protein